MRVEARRIETLLHRHEWIDDWFPFRYSFDPMSGCGHKCLFCRANWVDESSKKLVVKRPLLATLSEELRQIPPSQLIGIGGGINEPFSSHIPREDLGAFFDALKHIVQVGCRPFVATRSVLVRKLGKVFEGFSSPQNLPIVGLGLSAIDEASAAKLEPDHASVGERLEAAASLREVGIEVGLFAMPVVPFVGDAEEALLAFIHEAKRAKASFVLFQLLDGVALKNLWEKKIFEGSASEGIKKLLEDAEFQKSYYRQKEAFFVDACRREGVRVRLPRELFERHLSPKDSVTVLLLRMHAYQLRMGRRRDAYRFAAYKLNKTSEEAIKKLAKEGDLEGLPGFGKHIAGLVYKAILKNDLSPFDELEELFYSPKGGA